MSNYDHLNHNRWLDHGGAGMGPNYPSPAEQRTPIFDGPAPGAFPTAEAAAWAMLAHRHPRKYRKAMKQIAWLNRMQNYYLRRVNL